MQFSLRNVFAILMLTALVQSSPINVERAESRLNFNSHQEDINDLRYDDTLVEEVDCLGRRSEYSEVERRALALCF